MNYIFHFYSKTKVLMFFNNQSFEFVGLKHLSLNNFSNAKIVVYPQQFQQILSPLCFSLFVENNSISSNCNNLQICKVDSFEYVIILKEQFCGEQILLNKDNYLITNGLRVYYNLSNVCNERFYANFCESFNLNNITFFKITSFSDINKNNNLLLAFYKDRLLLKKQFVSLESSNNSILLLTDQKDSLNQGIVQEYSVLSDSLILKNTYSVYLNKDILSNLKEINTVSAFLDCGICNNTNLIKKFLSPDLMQNFSIQNFNGFFNNPSHYLIYFNKDNTCKTLVFNNSLYNIFEFTLLNNVITKIKKV